ncbi:MAG: nitrous oxide reductase accessory protein NosL [Proteobacteria bacterium]|nr:nitrous oxide reductase accessory protein NosL [Pseudomonadota bacterium]
MKKLIFYLTICMIFCISMPGLLLAQDDVQKHKSCKYCSMDREKFAHSRIFIEYDDGTTEGTCSLHCAAIDFAINIDKSPETIWVGDYNSKNLIDAQKAFWVIGGSKTGVMTKRAKWAFIYEEDAKKFIKENGGKPATFDEAIKAVYEDMYQDTKMVRKMRKLKKMIKQ